VRGLSRAVSEDGYSDGTGQRRANACAFGYSHSSFHGYLQPNDNRQCVRTPCGVSGSANYAESCRALQAS